MPNGRESSIGPVGPVGKAGCVHSRPSALVRFGFLLSLMLLLTSATARADGPAWLRWQPPPECPSSDYIVHRIEEWLDDPLPSDAGLAVQAHLDWTGSDWVVRVQVAFDGHIGERTIAVASCSDAADFVAVAVVLAVDPSLAGKLPLEGETTDPESSNPQPVTRDTPMPDTPALDGDNAKPGATTVVAQPPASVAAPKQRNVRPFAEAGAEVLGACLPEIHFGIGAGGGVEFGSVVLNLDGHFLPATGTTPENAIATIDFRLITASAGVSYFWPLGSRGGLGPRVSIEGGAVFTEQKTSTPATTTELWIAAAVGANAYAAPTPRVHFLAELAFVLPFTQPTFVLTDDSPVHQVGPGGRFSLGMRFFFTGQ